MENTESRARSSEIYEEQHPTHGFVPQQQGPPSTQNPAEPAWLANPPPKRRRRTPIVLAAVLGAVVLLVLGVVAGMSISSDDEPIAVMPMAAEGINAAADATNAPAGGGGSAFDLRKGAVFVQSNDESDNEVVAYSRAEDGTLVEVGQYETGGTGTGSFQDSAQGIVLGTSNGEASPQQHIDSAQLLFVSNAGSNSISVFRVNADTLQLVAEVPSGGETPVSLTVNRGLLYVLNNGELDNRLILGRPPMLAEDFLDNCTHGEPPSVTGFRVDPTGQLTMIPGSTRPLSGGQQSGCSQVSFTPDGTKLIATERVASLPGKTAAKGAMVIFDVNEDGMLGAKHVTDPAGVGPFGFTTTKDDTLLVSEQTHSAPGESTTSSYTVMEDGTTKVISAAVGSGGTDNCWVVATDDGRMAFTSNAFGGGTVSSYAIDENGALTLLHESATAEPGKAIEDDHLTDGTTDMALSRDSEYLYQLNSNLGLVQAFVVNDDGTLTFIADYKAFDGPTIETTGQLAPFGIAAY